ncbi:Transcriptional regulator, LysR family protein [Marinomonas sp. MED121]|uniref:LysR family transcriptional regulator n=1 Tax=Marinomonas sp. MED121 TaxID=314277 RepID=UPI0000690D6B|nr:LysR family transcriptional regulator [Marinomonas sp. MED121]EAQ65151.1 Transcriptional regulator, LysR family protein [Marinomonas sp. MED121]
MTPKQVRSLLAVHQDGSINKAAQRLHLAPSSISAQLKELAAELEVPLFESKGRNIQLSDIGLSLLPKFQAFCSQEIQIKQIAQNFKGSLKGNITLFAPSSLCIYRLPKLIEKLQESEPELEITLIHEPYDYETALKQNDINAAIIMSKTSELAIEEKKWGSKHLKLEPIIYVASPDFCRASTPLTVAELNQYPLITTEAECNYRRAADLHFVESGFILTPKQSFSNVEVIKRCLLAKMGIGLLPLCVVEEEIKRGSLVQIQVTGTPYLFQSHLIYPKQHTDNKKLSALLALAV